MAAYLKDVENNTRDMTADTIIKEKMNRIETKDVGTQKFNICINRNTLKKKKIKRKYITGGEFQSCTSSHARSTA